MENSSILSTKNDFKQVDFSWIVMHVNCDNRTWSRPSQEILIAHSTTAILTQTTDFVYLITIVINVKQLVILHKNAMNALTIHVHLLCVLLASKQLQLINELRLPDLFIYVCSGYLLSLGSHSPHLAILDVQVLQRVFSLGHVVELEILEIECLRQRELILLKPIGTIQIGATAIHQSRLLPGRPLLKLLIHHSTHTSAHSTRTTTHSRAAPHINHPLITNSRAHRTPNSTPALSGHARRRPLHHRGSHSLRRLLRGHGLLGLRWWDGDGRALGARLLIGTWIDSKCWGLNHDCKMF